MSKILITGANGLLATNTIAALLAKGYKIRGLLRSPGKYKGPLHPNLELIAGDITDDHSLDRALNECNYTIHVAALTSHNITKYSPYKTINVDATETLLKLSIAHGIKKFVSSANAFGFGSLKAPGNEETPIRPPFSKSLYALSKLEAQQQVLKYKNKIPLTVVNPTFMIGPYDGKPSSGQIILMGYKKKIIFCPPGGKNFVNVTDAAKGVVAALEKGKNGEPYLLAGENLTFRQFFQKLSKINSGRPIIVTIPAFILEIAGLWGNMLRRFGVKTQLSLTNMRMLCVHNFYSAEKATNHIGVQFGKIETGIQEAIKWFKENKVFDDNDS
jgi:dihydroflavonol-4-reductase